jgi:hypothetical protein
MEAFSRLGIFESDQEEGEVGLGRRATVRVEVDAGDEVAVAVCEVGDWQLLVVRPVMHVPSEYDTGDGTEDRRKRWEGAREGEQREAWEEREGEKVG